LWLHYFDPHASYVRHDEQPSFGSRRADRYDGEILYVDRQVQRFLDELKHRGLYHDVAVIVGSDHGEGIGLDTDHDFNYHGFSLFDSETRVPLMIKLPGASPRRVTECVGVIDVVPTLLELGGMSPPANLHGKTLIPYLLGANPKRGPFLMQLPVERPQEAVVDWPYKLIWDIKPNRFSLYDLVKDPFEQKDLAGSRAPEVARLKALLKLLRYEITQ
jgi:arylsulfatase A-like enzyme